jgi:hypothetical protein
MFNQTTFLFFTEERIEEDMESIQPIVEVVAAHEEEEEEEEEDVVHDVEITCTPFSFKAICSSSHFLFFIESALENENIHYYFDCILCVSIYYIEQNMVMPSLPSYFIQPV